MQQFLFLSLILFYSFTTRAIGQEIELSSSVGQGGENRARDVVLVQTRLNSLGFSWIEVDGKVGAATVGAIELFQSIKSGKRIVSGDGRVDVDGDTHKWLEAENAPHWTQMSAEGPGFKNIELLELADDHDFGTDWLDVTIKSAAKQYQDNYRKKHRSSLITVNDGSPERGGDTKDHNGHETGLDVDLRLPKIGESGPCPGGRTYKSADFDRDAATAILLAFRKQELVDKERIYFNDPRLIKKGLCKKLAGHDNHIHISIKPPKRK